MALEGKSQTISIHKALAGLDGEGCSADVNHNIYFNPQGPRGPRLIALTCAGEITGISIHKALAGLDYNAVHFFTCSNISIHKALAGLDMFWHRSEHTILLFQSTRPSRASTPGNMSDLKITIISIHKALAGLDGNDIYNISRELCISIHKALAGLDITSVNGGVDYIISIHKALAGLDYHSGIQS